MRPIRDRMDTFPIPTGQAVRLLDTTESRLTETVRRNRLNPPPPIVAGRRLWDRGHLLQAAEVLGILTSDLRERLETAEVTGG